MGVDSRRPPLPAPTDISSSAIGNTSDDLATDISRRTDRTSYTIPEDGHPVTISTKKIRAKDSSQTSLLIEYFEASKSGPGVHSRPSVRVRVTPSGSKRTRSSGDHIQVTELGKNRKPSYTRRISLPKSDDPLIPGEYSDTGSSDRPPVEVEVLQNLSDLSQYDQSQNPLISLGSDVSSMPPESNIGSKLAFRDPRDTYTTTQDRRETVAMDTLKAPARQRSLSRERLVAKALKKVQEGQTVPRESSGKQKSSSRRSSRSDGSNQYVLDEVIKSPKSRSTKYHDDDHLGSAVQASEISALTDRSAGQMSMRSGVSGASTSINNPKLLSAVEDAIKRLILPELNAVKEEQARQKNRMKFDDITRDSMAPVGSRENLRTERRVSKSSSSPNVAGKVAVITDDRGVVVPSDTIRTKKSRQSSRGSEKSHDTAIREESSHRRSSREKRHVEKEAGAAALVGAGLTYAALKHHDSISSLGDAPERERRKKRSKSRTRSRRTSVSESIEESPRKGTMAKGVPPLPMQSTFDTNTELTHATRESIQSVDTDRPLSRSSRGHHTPVREIHEVSRGSPRHVISPEPQTPTRSMTPTSTKRGLGTYHDNSVDFSPVSPRSIKSNKSEKTISEQAKLAGLAAAGLGGAALMHHHDNKRELTPTRNMSPAQSAASYRDDVEEHVEHERIRSIKSGGSLSAGRNAHKKRSNISIDSMSSSPTTNLASSKKRPEGISLERGFEVLPEDKFSPQTPQGGDVEQWLAHEHEENERYRTQNEEESQVGSSFVDHRRDTQFTDDSMMYEDRDKALLEGQNYHSVGANPEYVSTPVAVESAVASLHEPSLISVQSSQKTGSVRELEDPGSATRGVNMNSTTFQNPGSSKERWEAIRDQAIANVRQTAGTVSPRQSNASLDRYPVMGASALPLADEPMPEIGHGLDDASDVTTNPSIIQGPIGGLDHGDRSHWPYEPTPNMTNGKMSSRELHEDDHHGRNAALLGAGAGAAAVGLGLAAANARKASQERGSTPRDRDLGASVEQVHDEEWRQGSPRQQQYGFSPAAGKIDEGYMSGAVPGGELTPDPYAAEDQGYEDEEFEDEHDPFTTQKHMRHESGMSHGMASPLYDSATGRGIDRIQSKDIVALMDHLTVRDAQRNARDTEILVTLVRSAAETRNQFDDMKKYIAEQDRLIKENTNKGVDITIQQLRGPRPYMSKGSPSGQRRNYSEESEDTPTKRKNLFRRAFQGLSSKSGNDLTKIEGMLMQILDEMEDLKQLQGGGSSQHVDNSIRANTHSTDLDSYENLRAQEPDSGYEPEGRAGTGSNPNHSGHLSVPSSKQLAMHSGYDSRRPSDGHRISTVLEGDEEGDDRQYENEDRLLTPSQEVRRGQSVPLDTPPEQSGAFNPNSRSVEETPKTEKSRKHKSNTSSIFSGFPKISRWSKTTTSSAPDPETARNSTQRKGNGPYSHMSQSGSNLALDYDDDEYDLVEDDRLRSRTSFTKRGQTPRSPSPLIPEERHSMDDPKYQVHRNSLNLQHPQPRPGPTHRHQTYLESQAVSYENPPTPEADHWGNTPALALNRNRYSGGSHNPPDLSPVYDDEEDAYSQHSASEQAHNRGPSQSSQGPPRPPKVKSDEGPLVPPKVPFSSAPENSRPNATTMAPPQPIGFGYSSPFSNSGMHIASPLEPIEEVRYSLETDNSSLKQGRNNDMTPSPRPTAMQSVRRNITGPRDMPPRRGSPGGNLGTVRRKPVTARSPVQSLESYRGDSDEESETF